MKCFRKVDESGFTLVESVVAIGVAGIILLTIVSLAVVVIQFIEYGRSRVAAANLAGEKMEMLRNMPYDLLATQHGAIYPPGNIADNEIATVSGLTFNVRTIISYVDDPYDGNFAGTIPGKPVDIYPYDYKKAQIEITKPGKNDILARTVTNISAKAAETPTNTGILAITVLDAAGQPASGALVSIDNTTVSPPVDINTMTDVNGLVMIPMLAPDNGFDYQIRASYADYSTDQTYKATGIYQNPVNPNANILAQQVAYKTFSIDRKGTLVLDVVDGNGTALPNIKMTITGDKLIYESPDLPKTVVYATSSASGHAAVPNLEWDSYAITPPSGYYVSVTSPYQPVALDPAASVSAALTLTTSATAPRIASLTPVEVTGPEVLTITGFNFQSGLTLLIKKSGQTDIAPLSMTISADHKTITADFDFSGKEVGEWDVWITNPNGEKTVQKNGIIIQ